jgi:hypothetical protein
MYLYHDRGREKKKKRTKRDFIMHASKKKRQIV